MILNFSGRIIYWRGPAPFYFVDIPEKESLQIKSISKQVTYGWGVIPVKVLIGNTEFKTSLFPREDRYLLPVKLSVRKAEKLEKDDDVMIRLGI